MTRAEPMTIRDGITIGVLLILGILFVLVMDRPAFHPWIGLGFLAVAIYFAFETFRAYRRSAEAGRPFDKSLLSIGLNFGFLLIVILHFLVWPHLFEAATLVLFAIVLLEKRREWRAKRQEIVL